MDIRFTGFDSAWGGREKGAFCHIDGKFADGELTLTIAEAPVRANWDEAVSSVDGWLDCKNHVIAIDQGLVVPNLTKQRPVERKLASALMGPYGCGCHASNRSNESCYGPGAGIWRFLNELTQHGYRQSPMAIANRREGRFYFECYPHPAIIALFNLDSVLKYKVHKRNQQDWEKLIRLVRSLGDASLSIGNVCEFVPSDFRQCKGNEDILDSLVAAYVAAYFWNFGLEKSAIVGTLENGYMVTPVNQQMSELLKSKFDPDEFNSIEDAETELELIGESPKLVATDPGNIWGQANPWMIKENCEGWLLYVRFMDVDGEPDVVFGPFDNQGVKQFGMKPWGQDSKDNWKFIATGASKQNQLEYRVQVRYIPLSP